jgi:hypothetical protein
MSRGTNPKSLANLRNGNPGKRKPTANKVDANNTWAAMYAAVGELPLTPKEQTLLDEHGATDKWLASHGITRKKKFVQALHNQLEARDNPSMANIVTQREEPQDIGVKVKGEINVFQYETIDRLLASRSSGDPSEPSAS